MSPERWQQIKQILDTVEAVPTDRKLGAAREACGSDSELLTDVESFLEFDEDIADFIEDPLWSLTDDDGQGEPGDESGDGEQERHVGPYRLERLLGRGGMGAVYLARREGEYEQEVALKLVHWGMDSEEILARFYNERQILANLRHPGIAQLVDGGTTDDGRPYFAMEYVEGEPIDRYFEHHEMPVSARLAMFRKVCAAVHFAHQNLVVHRDLKPSNILVTEDGEPKLLDFGIAKVLQPELASREFATMPGRGPMTPDYASPEQILNTPITTACDVYALGVLLYRLLTGMPPYRLKNKGYAEIMNAICLAEPHRPSTVVGNTTVAEPHGRKRGAELEARRGDARRLRRQLSGDLDAIVMKAMRKEPRHRYGSAIELSDDLQRHLVGEPVQARQGNWVYFTGKFVRRYKLGLGMVLLILAFAVGVTVLWRQAVLEREQAEFERTRAERISKFLEQVFRSASPDRAQGDDVTVREVLDQGKERIPEDLADSPDLQAEMLGILGSVYRQLGFYDSARDLLEKALQARQESNPKDSTELATDINNLGTLLYALGDYREAERRYREALLMRRRLGQTDAETASVVLNLANSLKNQGKVELAESYLLQILASRDEVDGASQRMIGLSLHSLGTLYYMHGDPDASAELLRPALKILSGVYGPKNTKVASVLSSLGRMYHLQRDYRKARENYEEALRMRIDLLGEEHDRVATVRKNIAALLLDQGQVEEAGKLIDQALGSLRASKPDKDDWIIAEAESVLGFCLLAKKQYDEAEKYLLRSYEIIHEALGESNISTREAKDRLVHLYKTLGRSDEEDHYRNLPVSMPRFKGYKE